MASKGLNKPKGYEIEADGFSDLCITPQSQGLQVSHSCTLAPMHPCTHARMHTWALSVPPHRTSWRARLEPRAAMAQPLLEAPSGTAAAASGTAVELKVEGIGYSVRGCRCLCMGHL